MGTMEKENNNNNLTMRNQSVLLNEELNDSSV